MKTNNLYITLFAALAITACSKDNELPQGSAKDPNADMPDAYTSIAVSYTHLISIVYGPVVKWHSTTSGIFSNSGTTSLYIDPRSNFTPI